MKRAAPVFAFLLAAGAARPATADLPKVVLLGASATTPPDVKEKLQSTGAFSKVDIYDVNGKTPTLAELQAYDAAAVWSYIAFDDAVKMGDVLADYLEQGGGVVVFDYETFEQGSYELKGRYAATYALMATEKASDIATSPSGIGAIVEPGSPLLSGVKTFACATGSPCHRLTSATLHGATVVARWADGNPLVLRGAVNGHATVELNLFPASADIANGEWDSKTDGATLLKNALLYVLGGALRADRGALAFGSVAVGAAAPAQTLVYTNASAKPVVLGALALTGAHPGDFAVTPSVGLPATVAPGATLSASVGFQPVDVGTRSAVLETQVIGEPHPTKVALSGVGLGPTVTITPSPVDLGGAPLGKTLTAKLLVTNVGGGTLSLKSLAVTGDAASFAVTPAMPLPTALAPGQSLAATVVFSSLVEGKHQGQLTLSSQLPPIAVPLVAYTGSSAAMLSAASVNMGKQHVGVASPPTSLAVVATGFSDLTVVAINLSGPSATDYALSLPKLPATLAPGQSLPYSLVFKPAALGASAAKVTVTTDAPKGGVLTQSVAGEGVTFLEQVAPAKLDFGGVKGGLTKALPVTVTNLSGATLYLTSLTITGPNAAQFKVVNPPKPPAPVPPGGGLQTLTVSYAPGAVGPSAATLAIGLDDPQMPIAYVALAGVGIAGKLAVTPASLDFGGVVLGSDSAPQTLTLKNGGSDALLVSLLDLTGPGMSGYSTDAMTNFTIPIGQAAAIKVTFSPHVPGLHQAAVTFLTDDPLLPSVAIPLTGIGTQPRLLVDPLNIDFGVVPLTAASDDRIVTLSNTGDADLVVGFIGAGDPAVIVDRRSGSLRPGEKLAVKVRYVPRLAGVLSSQLTISPQGGILMDQTVELDGTAVSASLQVEPVRLSWPTITAGKKGDARTVTVTNTSKVPLAIATVSSTSPQFHVDQTGFQVDLAPGASTRFAVSFEPTLGGLDTAKVVLLLRGGTKEIGSVKVDGEGLLVPTPAPGGGCAAGGRPRPAAAPLVALALAVALLGGLSRRIRARRAPSGRRAR